MAARKWWQSVRPYFSRFSDALTGLIVGAGVTKIYYETTGAVKENLPIKQQIKELVEAHDNLKTESHLRKIDPRRKQRSEDSNLDEVDCSPDLHYKYGLPLRSPDYIRYTNHILCYDQSKKTPSWVAEHLTKEKVKGLASRENSLFQADPVLPEIFQSTNQDYLDSGWSRGHMAPASDNKFSQQAMNDTFLLSNIVPQNYENNSGFWYRMEVYCRNLTKQHNNVYVVSGPLYLPNEEEMGRKFVQYEVIGEHNVAVPTHLYKVILADDDNTFNPPVLGAFVVPNKPIGFDHQLQDFQVHIKDLEKAAGLIFFPKYNLSMTLDLCETDGCKLISKEFMEKIAFGWKLRNTESLQDLERVWEEGRRSKVAMDQITVEIYETKKEKLSLGYSVVDGDNVLHRKKVKNGEA